MKNKRLEERVNTPNITADGLVYIIVVGKRWV
jgi:hypothetical protein